MNLQFESPADETIGLSDHTDPNDTLLAKWFNIRRVSTTQQSYQPGGTITVTTVYGSDPERSIITPIDVNTDHPDACDYGSFGFSPGADLYLEVDGATNAETEGGCYDAINEGDITESVEASAPLSSGPHEITVRLRGFGTDTVYDEETVEVLVDDRAEEPPAPGCEGDGDCPDGQVCQDGRCVPEEEANTPLQDLINALSLGTGGAAAPLAILVVILVALLALGVAI